MQQGKNIGHMIYLGSDNVVALQVSGYFPLAGVQGQRPQRAR